MCGRVCVWCVSVCVLVFTQLMKACTVSADASVKAQRHEATRSSYLSYVANICTRRNRVGKTLLLKNVKSPLHIDITREQSIIVTRSLQKLLLELHWSLGSCSTLHTDTQTDRQTDTHTTVYLACTWAPRHNKDNIVIHTMHSSFTRTLHVPFQNGQLNFVWKLILISCH